MIKGTKIFEIRNDYLLEIPELYPPIYAAFYSTFKIGIGKLKSHGVLIEQIGQVAGILEQHIHCDVDFIIQDFLSFEQSNVFIKNSYEDDNVGLEYFPIAECDSNKAIVVGILESNSDQIFIENSDRFTDGSRYKLLAENIFEFMSKIRLIELGNIGYGIEGYDQSYKNWGEDFWRVKNK